MLLIGRLLFNIIEIVFITYFLDSNVLVQYEKRKYRFCTLLYLPYVFLWEDNELRIYIIKHIYLLLIFILHLLREECKLKEQMPVICAMLSIYEIAKIFIGVLGGLTAAMLPIVFISQEMQITVASTAYMIAFILIFVNIIKSKGDNYNWTFSKKCMACFIYALVILCKIPFLYTEIRDGLTLKLVFVTIICCTIIFFVISKIEHRNAEMEREKIEENNKKLSSKLHKSQEILPAVVQVLSNVTENNGKEMEGQETQELLNEMTTLYGQQLKENSKEDLQLKNFCSTGLKILDQQLKVYQMEAVDRGVNLDIYVQAPINDIIKWDDIDQLKLLRAVGDLVRNAFRITEKNKIIDRNGCEDKKCRANGHILLIIGCRYEGILEIAVVDNGEPFPLFVIEAFGRRGVTMGGTGNGLADLMEFASETKASIGLEELDGKTNSFTKKISIIFDKQRKNYLKSYREELIKSSFWIKTEY